MRQLQETIEFLKRRVERYKAAYELASAICDELEQEIDLLQNGGDIQPIKEGE
jgi:prefoldin subunit 5